MIIDSHQHFWIYNPTKDAWIDESKQVIQHDFLPKDLKPILLQNNIDGCIAVQADQSENETQFLLDLAKENSFIKAVVGWVNLCSNDVESRLAHFSKDKKLKGIRHILQAESNEFLLRNDFQNGISKLEKFNLIYEILIHKDQLENTILLVQKFPKQKFVLDHLAKPNIKDGEIIHWEKQIKQLAQHTNVHCKLSGLVTEADFQNHQYSDFIPYLDCVFEAFGSDRLLFGSDWPVCLLAANYNDVTSIIKKYIASFTIEEQKKIMGENATKIYQL